MKETEETEAEALAETFADGAELREHVLDVVKEVRSRLESLRPLEAVALAMDIRAALSASDRRHFLTGVAAWGGAPDQQLTCQHGGCDERMVNDDAMKRHDLAHRDACDDALSDAAALSKDDEADNPRERALDAAWCPQCHGDRPPQRGAR